MTAESLIEKLEALKLPGSSLKRIGINAGLALAKVAVRQEVEALVKELQGMKPKAPSGASIEMDTEWLVIDNCIGIIRKRLGDGA